MPAYRTQKGGVVTFADILIVLIVLSSTIMGFVRGFVREALSLVVWIGGIWAAWKFGPLVEPYLGGLLAEPAVRPWVGRLAILLLVILAGVIAGFVLQFFMRSIGLGLLDRVIGIMFGFLRGLVLVGLVVIGAELLQLNTEPWWNQSKLIPYGETVGDWLRGMVNEHGNPWAKLERLTGIKIH
jgi:membrane protein required for colicin V production